MMSVTVDAGGGVDEMTLGRPVLLFERPRNPAFPNFAVTPDGKRFIDLDDSVAEPAPTGLVLFQGFGRELERLVPPQ